MNFLELSEKVIREENRPLTANEIWEIAKKKHYDQEIQSQGKTPWATIAARIYVDIRDNPSTKFLKVQQDRVRFFLKELDQNILLKSSPDIETEPQFKERDLHKYLTYFVYTYKKIYTRTIFHESSNKKKHAEWLHPDMVGVYFAMERWEDEIVDFSKDLGNPNIKFFSFEIKKVLNFSNIREAYFQAVSNSSWANSGFLVAAEIDLDEEFQQELQRLVNAFGIGIIELDIEDPNASRILYQPREKDILDLETMNKLAIINSDFKDFLRRVKTDSTSKEVRIEKYDKIFEIEDLLNDSKKMRK